jgi:hypothetical protein
MPSTTERTREEQKRGENTLLVALYRANDHYSLMYMDSRELRVQCEGQFRSFLSDGPVLVMYDNGHLIPILWSESKYQESAGSAMDRLIAQATKIQTHFTMRGFSPFVAFCDGAAFGIDHARRDIKLHFREGFESTLPCEYGNAFIKATPWSIEEITEILIEIIDRRLKIAGPGNKKSIGN